MKALWSTLRQTIRLFGAHRKLWIPFLVIAVVEGVFLGLVWLAPHPPFSRVLAPPIQYFFGSRVLHYPAHLWFLYHVVKHVNIATSILIGAFMSGVACAMVRQTHDGQPLSFRAALMGRQVRYGRVTLLWVVTWTVAKGVVELLARAPLDPAALFWSTLGGAVALQTLLVYAIPAAVFDRVSWWRAIGRSLQEVARHPFSTLAVVLLPTALVVGFAVLAPSARVAQVMTETVPEVAVAFVVVRLLVLFLADSVLTVATAHLWWFHRRGAAAAAASTASVRPLAAGACALIGLPLMLATSGCSANYQGERLYWKAQQLHTAIANAPGQATPEQITQARQAYERVVAETPDTRWAAQAHLAIGALRGLRKEYDQARQAYELVLKNYHRYGDVSLEARMAIARTNEADRNWEAAAKAYGEIWEFHPWSTQGLEAPIYVALQQERRKELAEAQKTYDRAIRHYTRLLLDAPTPDMARVVKGHLALVLQRMERWQEAVTILEELAAAPSGTNRPMILVTLASIYQAKLGDTDTAQARYARVVEEFPDHALAKVASVQLQRLGSVGTTGPITDPVPTAAPAVPGAVTPSILTLPPASATP